MPLVSRAPQNRFFFPGLAVALATASVGVFLVLRDHWRRRDLKEATPEPPAGKIVYVLPAWDARSIEHYAHVVPFLREVGQQADLAVVVERASSPPPLSTARVVEVLPAGWPPAARMVAFAWQLVRLRRRGYNRVFVRISQPAALVAGSVGRLLGIRSYYWNSGQGKNLAPAWGPGLSQAWRRLRYEAQLLPFYLATRLVHRFVTGPECMRPYFARAYGVPQRRTIVLYNDLDVDSFQRCLSTEPRSAARRKLGLPEDGPVVLFVGRVSPLKGGPYLLPLAERILRKTEDATMVIVGPVHIPEFRVQWATHPHRHRIHLVGPLSNAEIARAYACADVMVIPSNSEGFPRVLLECMAAGLPFAAFDVGGIKEIADPAHSPYIVPRGDVDALAAAVVDLLRDPQRRRELAEIGRTRVRRYHTPEVAAMFVSRIVLDGEEPARP
jgi:glycosyltransferase involved in cell wall biosynthesis